MKQKTATLLGGTGLIGSHILKILEADNYFEKVNVVVRRPVNFNRSKINGKVIDFNDQDQFKESMKNTDVVFCAIGTTQRKVNNDIHAYRKIDYDIPCNAALYSKENGCKQFVIVSSLGAGGYKRNFYLKLKGEVEDRLKKIGFDSLLIFRPSFLLGSRLEKRSFEKFGKVFFKAISYLLPSKFKPVEADKVAAAMVAAAKKEFVGVHVFHYREIMNLSAH